MPEATFDVLVVGSGMAGLCAALTAAERNYTVAVLESRKELGGTTRLSPAYFNACDPRRQVKQNLEDSPEKHLRQLLAAGGWRGRRDLAEVLCYEAPNTLSWLEQQGIEFLPYVFQAPGAPYPRTHRPLNGGKGCVDTLITRLKEHRTQFFTEEAATRLVTSPNGRVIGIETLSQNRIPRRFNARLGVVLASGGFTAAPSLVKTHCPLLASVPSASAPGCNGDMLLKACDIGAEVTHMGFFVWDFDTHMNPRLLADASRYVLLDAEGHRFIREDLHRRDLITAILVTPSKRAWLVTCGTTPSASDLPFSDVALENSMGVYNRTAATDRKDPLGKNPLLMQPLQKPWTIAELRINTITSLGGLCITTKAQVINRYGQPIAGLTAAGDVTGGIHGEWACVGDCMASAAVFGRLAALTLCSG